MVGGLAVWDNAHVTLTCGSSVQDNNAEFSGGGLDVVSSNVAVTDGSSVQSNMAGSAPGWCTTW